MKTQITSAAVTSQLLHGPCSFCKFPGSLKAIDKVPIKEFHYRDDATKKPEDLPCFLETSLEILINSLGGFRVVNPGQLAHSQD